MMARPLNRSVCAAQEQASHFLLVEAERYRYLAQRTTDEHMAALWRRIVDEYEDLARRHDEHREQAVVRTHASETKRAVGSSRWELK
jgi:hypothetical protein